MIYEKVMKATKVAMVAAMAVVGACVPPASPQGGAAPELNSAPAWDGSALVGRYVANLGGNRAEIALEAGGRALIAGAPGQWTMQNDALWLNDGQQWVQASYDTTSFTIQTPNGPIVFQRDDGGGVQPAVATTVASTPATGAIDGQLVGCWQLFENHSDYRTGGAMSEKTIKLGADGTFFARSYVSVSAGELSSSDEDTDDGTWRVTGGNLIFDSRTAGPAQASYRVESGVLTMNGRRFLRCS